MEPYRVYIDESGDHAYKKITEHDYQRRYLALTGVLIRTDEYAMRAQPALEQLKRDHLRHDPDHTNWTFLHRDDIIKRRRAFGVLRDPAKNAAWEQAILDYYTNLRAEVYTVVLDKWATKQQYGPMAFEPYDFCLWVLLNRIRGLLYFYRGHATADVIAETRGWRKTDPSLQAAYDEMRTQGKGERPAAEYQQAYPNPYIEIRNKADNVGGIQIADLIVSEQKQKTLLEHGLPISRPLSPFQEQLNAVIETKVHMPYSRVMLGG